MKIANYNQLRAAVFMDATKDPEVADALRYSDRCCLYDVIDGENQHGILVLTARTQLNDNVLTENGFDPATASAKLVLTLDRKTKCATF